MLVTNKTQQIMGFLYVSLKLREIQTSILASHRENKILSPVYWTPQQLFPTQTWWTSSVFGHHKRCYSYWGEPGERRNVDNASTSSIIPDKHDCLSSQSRVMTQVDPKRSIRDFSSSFSPSTIHPLVHIPRRSQETFLKGSVRYLQGHPGMNKWI